jgi:hypothetical protein
MGNFTIRPLLPLYINTKRTLMGIYYFCKLFNLLIYMDVNIYYFGKLFNLLIYMEVNILLKEFYFYFSKEEKRKISYVVLLLF